MTAGHGNYYDVDGRSLDERWPDADSVAGIGGPVRDLKTDGGQDRDDIKHEVTQRDVSDLSKAALYAEWSQAYEQLLGTVPDERRDDLWNRRRELWSEMRDRTDANPPECPECGHTRWQQEFGGPKSCCECGWTPTADEMDLIDAIDRYWSKVQSIGEDATDQLVTDGGQPVDGIDRGKLETTRSAGAHDEFIAFVAGYPNSAVAETVETAISLNALDNFQSFSGSFAGSLWEYGVKKAGNPDTKNAKRVRELFPEERWPEWMQQEYGGGDSVE